MPVEDGSSPASPPAEITPAQTPVAASPAAPSDASAAPSPAKDESVLDAVKAAIAPKPAGSSPAPASQEAAPNPDAPSEDDEQEPDSDPTEEEQARYHSKTRKQIRRLLSQRNEALDKVKDLEPHAQIGERLTSFISDAGMTADEANLLLDIGRNLKKDPLKALAQMKPYYDALQRMAGESALPPELQADVAAGKITEDYARRLVRGNTENSVLARQTQAQAEEQQRQQRLRESEQHGADVSSTISTWESNQAKNDPDWKLKQPRIAELIELDVRRNGYPKTRQAALDMAEAAKTKVNADFAQLAPRRPAVTPLNPASNARIAPTPPKNAYEAARLAITG